MPNWTDENGYSWFGKIECKRCLGRFKTDEDGEIPIHECIGGLFKSDSSYGEYHYVVFVKEYKWGDK